MKKNEQKPEAPVKVPAAKELMKAQIERVLEKAGIKTAGSEGFLLSLNFVRDGRLHHMLEYFNFPDGDWGKVIENLQEEAKTITIQKSKKSGK